jgi:hypothetical protein
MAYYDPTVAYDHARTISGVEVDACEIRDGLSPVAVDDVYVAELDDIDNWDEETPVDELPPLPPVTAKKRG